MVIAKRYKIVSTRWIRYNVASCNTLYKTETGMERPQSLLTLPSANTNIQNREMGFVQNTQNRTFLDTWSHQSLLQDISSSSSNNNNNTFNLQSSTFNRQNSTFSSPQNMSTTTSRNNNNNHNSPNRNFSQFGSSGSVVTSGRQRSEDIHTVWGAGSF